MNLFKKTLFISILAITSASFAAPAQSAKDNWGHFYVGGQLGFGGMQAGIKNNNDDNTDYRQSKGNKTGIDYRIFGGYLYDVSPEFKIGPELGYEKYGDHEFDIYQLDVKQSSFKVSGATVDLLLNTQFYFTDNFYGIGKVGVGYLHQRETLGTDHENTNDFAPKLGLGLGYQLNQHVNVNFTVNGTIGKTLTFPLADNATKVPVARTVSFLFGAAYSF